MGIIFKQIAEIESSHKTQTRRAVKEGETYMLRGDTQNRFIEDLAMRHGEYRNVESVYTPSRRKKWRVGDVVPMIPKMYQRGVGYVRIKSIRLERLGDISEGDAIAEGIKKEGEFVGGGGDGYEYGYGASVNGVFVCEHSTAVEAYGELWESINGIGSWQKQQNDLVWVLGFEYIGKVKPTKAKTK